MQKILTVGPAALSEQFFEGGLHHQTPGVQFLFCCFQHTLNLFILKRFQTIGQGAEAKRLLGIGKVGVSADDNKLNLGQLLPDFPHQVQTGQARHPNVGKDNIRADKFNHAQSLMTAGTGSHDLKAAAFPVKTQRQTIDNHLLVVHNHDLIHLMSVPFKVEINRNHNLDCSSLAQYTVDGEAVLFPVYQSDALMDILHPYMVGRLAYRMLSL